MKQSASTPTTERALSIAQQRLWVLEQLHPGSPVQNVAMALRWTQKVDQASLERCLADLLDRHEILQTEFRIVNGTPSQIATRAPIVLKVEDVSRIPSAERTARLVSLHQSEVATAFDLTRGPLIRATLFRVAEEDHVIALVAHRIVCDANSLHLLLGELQSDYATRVQGTILQPAEIQQYSDLAFQDSSTPDLSYWRKRLAGAASSIEFPTDHPRPPLQTFLGGRQRMRLEPPLVGELRHVSQIQGVSLFATLLASFEVLLFRYTRQEDMVVGTRVSGRGEPAFRRTIGPLENMLALRTSISGDPTFADLLMRVHESVTGALEHSRVPFESLVRDLRLERDMSRHPLFQIMVAMRNSDVRDPGLLIADRNLVEVENPSEQFDLNIEFAECDGALETVLSYSSDLFEPPTIARMMGHLRTLIESVARDPHAPVSRMPLMAEGERRQLLLDWNATEVAYPRDVPLNQLIEDQVEKTPDSAAVIYESTQLSYRQLNERANQLAHYLRKCGVGPDMIVGVCAERSIEMVVALLATLKAGGAYVPLDPEYPKDRLEAMLQDANPKVVLAQERLLDRLPNNSEGVFCLDRDWRLLEPESTENLSVICGGQNLAYAIYTSGSTGKPKGVPNVHAGIVNRLLWMQDMYKLTASDRVLQKTPFSFDVSVWEFFWPLLAGATLVVARPGGHRDAAYLVDLIAQQKVTTLHFVPSMLNIFLESASIGRCRSIRRVFASGEALSFELQQRFFDRLPAELHNLYGPTEAAVDVTYWACRRDSGQSIVPIGKPVANTQIYILDPNLQPVPIGVPGELHIGGIQLARGYLNRPELTAEKFIRDPFSETPGARLYKTGDLARFLPDGNVEYLGRIDFQVKLRGFRIELGEIEAVLGECAGVLQAVVAVRQDRADDKRLVAYLIAATGRDLDLARLRTELGKHLPEHMVPSQFVVMETFPMTTSGKVDRKALPAPAVDRDAATMVAPRTELESRLTALFAGVLGLPAVGVTDNFFELGGHSLLAGRLLAEVQEATGRQISLSALFRGATVESLAQLIEQTPGPEHDPVVMEIHHGARSRFPFFAIVPPGEESLGYAMLARHMGPKQTVFKIQGQSPITGGKRPYSVKEMRDLANEYVAAMRAVQPTGPYCLGGFCDGTHIAEQIVLKLEAQGEEVGLFAIFDTWVLQHSQRRLLWKIYYYSQRLREMKKLSVPQRIASYKRVAGNKVQSLVGVQSGRTDWQQAYWPEDFTPPRFRAPVVLFKRPKQPYYYVDDPQMGWGTRSGGGVEIHEVDFHHLEILREPHVRIFGEELAECIGRLSAARANNLEDHETSLTVSASGRRQGS